MRDARTLALAVVFAFDADLSHRAQQALHLDAQVQVTRSEADCLRPEIRESAALIVLELSRQTATPVGRILRALSDREPSLRVVGYCTPRQDCALAVMAAVRGGLDGLIFTGPDDTQALKKAVAVREFEFADGLEYVLCTIAPVVLPEVEGLLRQALRAPVQCHTVEELARYLRMTPPALAKILRYFGGPVPEGFRSWRLLTWAAYALQSSTWSVERIARALGFSDSSGLTHLMERNVGMTPERLRREDALLIVARAFWRAPDLSRQDSVTERGTPEPISRGVI